MTIRKPSDDIYSTTAAYEHMMRMWHKC